MQKLLAFLNLLLVVMACNDDIPNDPPDYPPHYDTIYIIDTVIVDTLCIDTTYITPLNGLIKTIMLGENNMYLYNLHYNLLTRELTHVTDEFGNIIYAIEELSESQIKLNDFTGDDLLVTINDGLVTHIEPLSRTTYIAASGFYDLRMTYSDLGVLDTVYIGFDIYLEPPVDSRYYNGVLTEFIYNGSYIGSTYHVNREYLSDITTLRYNFDISPSTILSEVPLPLQYPCDFFVYDAEPTLAPQIPPYSITNEINPIYILSLAGYNIFERTSLVVSTINDSYYEYEINANNRVVGITLNSTVLPSSSPRTVSITYYD